MEERWVVLRLLVERKYVESWHDWNYLENKLKVWLLAKWTNSKATCRQLTCRKKTWRKTTIRRTMLRKKNCRETACTKETYWNAIRRKTKDRRIACRKAIHRMYFAQIKVAERWLQERQQIDIPLTERQLKER